MSLPANKLRLGDMLVAQGVITPEQLLEALAEQGRTGGRLGRVLVARGLLSERSLALSLASQLRCEYVDLRAFDLDPEVARQLPEVQARRLRAIPLKSLGRRRGEPVLVGFSDPLDVNAVVEVERLLGRELQIAVVEDGKLATLFDRLYRRTEEISGLARELEKDLGAVDLGQLSLTAKAEDAPVVRLLHSMLADAVRARASDVHIEPHEGRLRIRFRIDGSLFTQTETDPKIGPALVMRLKIVAGLDIAERRLPQDGRFVAQLDGGAVDIRLSTLPTQHGETVAMRLLERQAGLRSLEETGLSASMLDTLRLAARRGHGMVLVTGPTGSGKTSTLYSLLAEMNASDSKLISVEDPVEIRLPGVMQVQVNEKIGLAFSTVLRSMLRQDPDVLLIGEMRDAETVETGLRAAMTGHMVLSTLHTNDAASTPARLIDMGAAPYLVAMSLQIVIAQRLVRRVCPSCARPVTPDARERAFLARLAPGAALEGLRRGEGCVECNGTGHAGRAGVFEMLCMDGDLIDALARLESGAFAERARERIGEATLQRHAADRALAGETTLAEAMRLANGIEGG